MKDWNVIRRLMKRKKWSRFDTGKPFHVKHEDEKITMNRFNHSECIYNEWDEEPVSFAALMTGFY